jgi:hypothetical protein
MRGVLPMTLQTDNGQVQSLNNIKVIAPRTKILAPMSYGLNFDSHLLRASCPVSFARFTFGRLSHILENVKLWESPRQSRGFTPINYAMHMAKEPL